MKQTGGKMSRFEALNFKKWIDENRSHFKPPIGNRLVWPNRDFVVMVVGGPNCRTDYHINEGEEFFYQLEGTLTLRLRDESKEEGRKIEDLEIRAGDIFLLPARVPHSPQRPAGTLGVVIERRRQTNEKDTLLWHCQKCDHFLYQESFALTDITKDFKPVIDRFYTNQENCTCKVCGYHEKN
jgi:3-hydroxyanthranilate 3,4-dioxygenase